MNNNRNKVSGITLIALVITIIVLIILAGVSIAMLTGDNGLLKKVEEARINSDKAELKEYEDLLKTELKIDEYTSNENQTQDETISKIARTLGVSEENITGNLIKSADGKYGIMVKDDNSIEVAKIEDAYVSANYIEPTDVSEFIWEELTDGTIWLKEYIGTAKSINIPDTIEGKRISKIGGDKYTQSSVQMTTDENGNVSLVPGKTESVRIGPVIRNKGVKSIKFPSDVNRITSDAFNKADIEEVFFTDGPEVMDARAFTDNKIKRLKLPNKSKYIGDYVFERNLLEKVEFNSGLEYICNRTFADNYLTKIELPNSIKDLGAGGAFTNNNVDMLLYAISNGVEDRTRINSYCGKNAGDLIIPSGVKTIDSCAIYNIDIKSIYIPESVQSIGVFSISTTSPMDSIVIKGTPSLTLYSIDLDKVNHVEINYTNGGRKTGFPGIYIKRAEEILVPYSEDGSILESYRNNINTSSNFIYAKEYGSIEEKSN